MIFGRNSGLRTGELPPRAIDGSAEPRRTSVVPDRKDTPAVTDSRYKNENGREKILSVGLFQSIEAL